ncbi:DUF3298 domain-containing protein [Brevundimonas sp. BH3]|uniref:DUF3298 and DUF4163 domain-containing protein n=1 Tax=unclassified Brevundimonas TaxID=2622653 RepID=UPI00289D4ACE|nr:DUF3298 domain-containing protein [Brevundimonas sp.]
MKISRTFRYLLLGSALAIGVTACDRDKAKEVEKPAAIAEVDGPLTYESSTPYAKVSLTLPEAIKGYPDLYKQLYDAEVGKLKDYSEGAQSDRSEFGSADLPPYEKTILYSQPVETGRLFSMLRSDFDYSGGAHPNTVATGLLWDRTTNQMLSASDLFATDADKAALNRMLCDAVNTAKKGRQGAVPLQASGMWTCPDASKVAIMLAPSDTTGKASGITFLLNAYDVGPYVEGAYYLTIPFETLGKAINPTYAAEFAGTGAKGDVTQTLRPQ